MALSAIFLGLLGCGDAPALKSSDAAQAGEQHTPIHHGSAGAGSSNSPDPVAGDPTITDVHTQPADAAGNIVGRVLHVATGLPRRMAVTVDTCAGPRAYVGLAYAYHEQITQDCERLTDEAWNERLNGGAAPPAEVPWMQDLVARQ